ncbi:MULTISPECIES: succinate dehydrogenase cytochrome b subunit [Butyricimonas]|jgi:succinate dehydrogenase cytochrome B subunit, b558 family|uniref:Succinate dehydrogenase cytochrome b subunit n=1 Tax=Butyricimonas hominis TaxID=2763032 RepID=A0ABR7D3E0_9BACT|nr:MULTISPECIES: succinate dehydrogenase cytochrome b subunit [Butyricimonas]MBC5622460.1 succinate dehydrogenase cytochrome b subunit [Butyricimonas hominis]MCB6974891.1 succinate dehydrogenase cytochrome b subunit [Butyricimonas synergistica]
MSNFLTSSIGKKMLLSISGLFLIAFLCVHLALNLLLIVDNSGELFNIGAHFMATNPIIKIVEPILAIGFIFHIVLASILTLQNRGARPIKYDRRSQAGNCTWSSRNMYILGALVLIFLVIHLWNFWWNIKFPSLGTPLAETIVDGVKMENTYALVAGLFQSSVIYCLLYILGGIFLGLHLTHGFWSAFQSIGFSNQIWRKRLECVAKIFAFIIAAGFSIIPLYFMLGLAN